MAFGNGDTKGCVINMAKWTKSKLLVSFICFLLCTTLLVACAANPQTAESSVDTNGTEITGKVTTSNSLNIREEPSTTSAIVGDYSDGTIITILEIKDGWGRTDLGWVTLDFITTMDGPPLVDIGQIEPSSITDIENKVKELNIREKPDISSAIVGTYPDGLNLTILETQDGWGLTDQGWILMKYVATVDGKTIVNVTDYEHATDGSVSITYSELMQYRTLKMLLPLGFLYMEQDGAIVLTKDSVAVGGVMQWKYPEFQPSDIVELKKEESGVPIGYMSGSSAYGDAEYEVFWDGNPEGLNEQHTFFIDGDIIYDVWYDENQISDGIAEQFLKTVSINADPAVEAVQSSTNNNFDDEETNFSI